MREWWQHDRLHRNERSECRARRACPGRLSVRNNVPDEKLATADSAAMALPIKEGAIAVNAYALIAMVGDPFPFLEPHA